MGDLGGVVRLRKSEEETMRLGSASGVQTLVWVIDFVG